ncbi:MAG TPA: transglycosylase SLT domain-containing protein [Polyangiaceae bacterium]|nr:transglycosylase SLT domain-containing protein [Polyangiaceae bacterium]
MVWKAPLAAFLALLAQTSWAGAADGQRDSTSPSTKSAGKAGDSSRTRSADAKPAKPEKAAAKPASEPPSGNKDSVKSAPKGAPGKGAPATSVVQAPGSLPAVELAAASSPATGVDPKRGRGARNVGEEPAVARPEPPVPDSSAKVVSGSPKASKATTAASKPDSKAAKRAAATKGGTRGEPDLAQRRQIAAGPTADDVLSGKDDAELRSLREAELVLFPRPLPGFVPGWTWDLPKSVEPSVPEIVAGAPAASRAAVLPKEPTPDAEWLRGLSMPNLPVRLEDRVLRYLSFYRDAPSGRAIARAWAKKSGRYSAALKAELAKAGLPTDLVWLSLIESGHNPSVVSVAGAAGLWQFMPDAGRAYGLVVDRWVDERLDPQRSTEAACRYLSDLYRRFGGWELAMAAYNMGHGGLSRAIRKYNTNDFWGLSRYEAGLPWETTLYVPKILATAILMGNKRAFALDDVEPEPPERFETVLVASGVLLEDLARLSGVPLSTIESLNPQYLAGRTPPSPPSAGARSWSVRVPAGSVANVREALARDAPSDESFMPYLVRVGDTVESIAQARGATEAQIRALNRVDPKEVLAPGTVLLVPRSERTREGEAFDNVAVVPPRSFDYPERKRVFYRALSGDSLSRVADIFGVTRGELALWNALDESARLPAGLMLQLFVSERRDLSKVRCLTQAQAKILVAGSPEFFDYFEGQSGRRRFVVRAKGGDTLASIGKRYGATVGSMERINRRSRTDPVASGEPIVVYTERTRPQAGDELYVDPHPRSEVAGVQRSDAAAGAAAIADAPNVE